MTSGLSPRRLIVLVTIIVLGLVAAGDMDVRYEPDLTMPEVHLGLWLPPSLSLQPGDVARRWAVPLESGVRAVGGVSALSGRVSTTGVELTARFEAGTDVDTKIARIQSELEPLRAELPEDASLNISAERAEAGTYLALTGELQPKAVRRIEDELAATPSVRGVRSFGNQRAVTTVDVATPTRMEDELVRQAAGEIATIGHVSRLGGVRVGGDDIPVYLRGPASLRDVLIDTGTGVVGLDVVAEIDRARGRRDSGGRYAGRSAIVIGIQRDADVPLLTFDRELGRRLEKIRRELPPGSALGVIQNEAEPFRRFLYRAGLGLSGAMLALAVAGWFAGGAAGLLVGLLAIPTALSISVNVIRLTQLQLDVTTIPSLGVGLLVPAALLLVPSRAGRAIAWAAITILCGVALPVAVIFGAGVLKTFLIAPAWACAVGMSSVAVCLVLFPSIENQSRRRDHGRMIRPLLRSAPTLLLAVGTACYAFFALFGSGLDPRKGSVVPDRGRILVRASLPEGTTLEQAESGAGRLEEKIGLVEGVEGTWGRVTPTEIVLVVDVAPDKRSAADLEEISGEIRYRARLPFGHVVIRQGSSGSRVDAGLLEIEPEADDAGRYELVLEGDDIEEIELAVDRIQSVVWGVHPAVRAVPEWGTRSIRVELRPAGPRSQAKARQLASLITARTAPPREMPVGREEFVLVRRAGQDDPWTAPRRGEAFDVPLVSGASSIVAAEHLVAEEEVVAPTVSRQAGRFAVRVQVTHSGTLDPDHWLGLRTEIDRRLGMLSFMSGAEMKRPEIRRFRLSDDGWRLMIMALAVPVLIVLIAIVWADSLWRFLPFILPAVTGVAATTPLLRLAGIGVDELSLLMLAACSFGVLAVALACGERLTRGGHLVANGYRAVVMSAVPVVGAAVASVALFIGPTIGTDAARDPWVSGARVAGVAALVGLPAAALLPSMAFFGIETARRRRRPESRAKRRPSAWMGDAPICLEVRHVSKIYRGGFCALRDVSFDLQPGIVGLLGPNGAGKTTLLRILTGLLLPSRGQVSYRGQPVGPENIDAFREHIGFLPQSFNAYAGFTAEDFVNFWAMQAGITNRTKRAEEVDLLIAAVGLEEHARRKVRDFSGGMRQRIGIARALIAQPDLLVVDEPTTGLDIEGRSRFRGLMLSVAAHRVVVLSTHIAGDVEATCSRVLVLHRGRLRFDGRPEELIERAEGRVFEMTVDDRDIHEISARYRLTRRVRVVDGIRVKGVVPSGESLPGPAGPPGLEEAYLAEIELADVAVGRKAKFTFLSD